MPSYYATKANGYAQGGGIYLRRTDSDGNIDTVYVPIGTSSSTPMAGTTSGGAIWGSTGGGSISGTANGTANASSAFGTFQNGAVSGSIGQGGVPRDIPETLRQFLITSTSAVSFEPSHKYVSSRYIFM